MGRFFRYTVTYRTNNGELATLQGHGFGDLFAVCEIVAAKLVYRGVLVSRCVRWE